MVTASRTLLGNFHNIEAEIIEHDVWDVPANALVLHLPQSRKILSGMSGYRPVDTVCNFHIPKPFWMKLHDWNCDWNSYYQEVLNITPTGKEISLKRLAMMSTGVNMHQLAWAEESFKNAWVLAFVTAGVRGNALRIGVDSGSHGPIGTINTIVLTSAALTQAAMAASFITITEAKVIALEDLQIKSCYNPELQASGTGTDQIIVVSGKGPECQYVGGHTKIGELMARAVTRATKEAIAKRWNIFD